MSMDIEKICRTCLALSGPLLSIFDGSSGGSCGSGCVADMLKDFTKMKPKPADKLPERVCLSCISEINRCYSFKMKCENANKTLRQLLPDAVAEAEDQSDLSKPKRVLVDQCVQTLPEVQTVWVSTEAQTDESWRVQQYHQASQTKWEGTEQATTSMNKNTNNTKQALFKVEEVLVQENMQELSQNECDLNVIRPKVENTNEMRLKKLSFAESQERGDDDIIFELQTESVQEMQALEDGSEACNQSEMGETESTTAYYVLSNAHEIVEGQEVHYETEANMSGIENADNKLPQTHDLNFTIVQTAEGGEEVTMAPNPLPKTCGPTFNILVERNEVRCPDCTMTFVSIRNLRRHCLKIHGWSKHEVSELQEQTKTVRKKAARGEKESDVVSTEDFETAILQELHDEVVAEEEGQEDALKIEQPSKRETQKVDAPSAPTVFCPRCNAGFAFQKSLNYHMKQNQCTAKAFACSECQRVFTSKEGLEEHHEYHLLQHSCTECNHVFDGKEALSEHLIEKHNRSKRNQCKVCNKVFTMVSALKDHLRIHSGEKPFLCPTCGKGFRQNTNLKQHIMRHSKIKPFKCDECPVSFVSKSELFSHKRTHTGDHPFKCDLCGTCYTTSSSLAKHKRKHTGERPYACDLCPMRFSALNVLKNHRRTHTGEKPFHCTFCNKAFAQKSDCQIHQRTHTGEKRYSCMCGTAFTHLSSLRIHQQVHYKEGNPPKRRKKARTESVDGEPREQMSTVMVLDDDDEPSEAKTHEVTMILNEKGEEEEFVHISIERDMS